MRLQCDYPDIDKKYMVDGSCINVCHKGLTNNSFVYVGHDLPVWIGNSKIETDSIDCKIMIVGRDPGRKPYDMYQMRPLCNQITICSPFGMHSRYHRRKMMVIPHMVNEILKCATGCDKTATVYITDYYKLKLTNSTAINTTNKQYYNAVYADEIRHFKPNVVILLGKTVMNVLGIPPNAPYFQIYNGKYLPIPHPSGNNGNVIKKWKETDHETKDFFAKMVCKQLKTICC